MTSVHRVVALASAPQSLFELASAAEVFGTSRPNVKNNYSWSVCAQTPGPVASSGGTTLTVAFGLEALTHADTVVVAGYLHYEEPAGVEVLTALRDAHARGARVVSICTGAFLLAQAGLLTGRRATVHWRMREDFHRLHPEVEVDIDALYVDLDDVATSAGTAAGVDLCLHLVRRDFGAAHAAEIACHMVMPPHREGGQLQYRHRREAAAHSDSLGPLLDWARANLDSTLSVDVLASRAHLSTRTLSRRFVNQLGVGPGQWILTQRVDEARRLLETTDLTIESVSERVGLSSATNLRRRFGALVGTGPAAYRRTFGRR